VPAGLRPQVPEAEAGLAERRENHITLDHVCAVSGLWWLRQAPGAAFVASAIPVLTLAGMFVFVSRRERAKEKAETLKS
jgi:hypothetical protein